MQRGQKAALSRQLAHGPQQRKASLRVLHILIGRGGHAAAKQHIRLLRVRIGMDVGKQYLVSPHPLVLLRKQLFYLVVQLRFTPNRFTVGDDRSHSLIRLICETAADAGSCLHIHGVAVPDDLLHGGRGGSYAVFVLFDLFQDADLHVCIASSVMY